MSVGKLRWTGTSYREEAYMWIADALVTNMERGEERSTGGGMTGVGYTLVFSGMKVLGYPMSLESPWLQPQ